LFFPGSRYAQAGTYQVTAPDGSMITVTRLPLPVGGPVLGFYRRSLGERLDLLAANYAGDPTAAWVLGWVNGAVSLDALASHDLIAIPGQA
jgi:hypothetical protein